MQPPPDCADPVRFAEALRRFDEANAADPHRERMDGTLQPREVVYAGWLSDWVLRLRPDASEGLRLAARCQHLCRWMIPRASHAATRAGYLQWREALKRFHAERAGDILRAVGYGEEVIGRVQSLNLKQHLATDAECQTLEDALCLVFIEHQLAALADKTPREKLLAALQKAWRKMSPAAQAAARALRLPAREAELLAAALAAAAQ